MKTATNSDVFEQIINFILGVVWHGRYFWAGCIGFYFGVK